MFRKSELTWWPFQIPNLGKAPFFIPYTMDKNHKKVTTGGNPPQTLRECVDQRRLRRGPRHPNTSREGILDIFGPQKHTTKNTFSQRIWMYIIGRLNKSWVCLSILWIPEICDSRSKVLHSNFSLGVSQPTHLYDFSISLCGGFPFLTSNWMHLFACAELARKMQLDFSDWGPAELTCSAKTSGKNLYFTIMKWYTVDIFFP